MVSLACKISESVTVNVCAKVDKVGELPCENDSHTKEIHADEGAISKCPCVCV